MIARTTAGQKGYWRYLPSTTSSIAYDLLHFLRIIWFSFWSDFLIFWSFWFPDLIFIDVLVCGNVEFEKTFTARRGEIFATRAVDGNGDGDDWLRRGDKIFGSRDVAGSGSISDDRLSGESEIFASGDADSSDLKDDGFHGTTCKLVTGADSKSCNDDNDVVDDERFEVISEYVGGVGDDEECGDRAFFSSLSTNGLCDDGPIFDATSFSRCCNFSSLSCSSSSIFWYFFIMFCSLISSFFSLSCSSSFCVRYLRIFTAVSRLLSAITFSDLFNFISLDFSSFKNRNILRLHSIRFRCIWRGVESWIRIVSPLPRGEVLGALREDERRVHCGGVSVFSSRWRLLRLWRSFRRIFFFNYIKK